MSQDTSGHATIECIDNGPYIVKNLAAMVDARDEPFEVKPRLALCRCGQSGNKPFCDGTHGKVGFAAPGTPEPSESAAPGGRIRVRDDGPYKVEGAVIEHPDRPDDPVALCRCGHSASKPFCDGTHREVGFKDPA